MGSGTTSSATRAWNVSFPILLLDYNTKNEYHIIVNLKSQGTSTSFADTPKLNGYPGVYNFKSQESPQVVETSVHMKEWATDCEVPAAALTRLSLPGLPDDQWNEGWIMAISNQNHCLAQQHWSEWTEILADSGAAERVFSEHHFSRAPIRPASRVVMRTADGTKVVTDYVKRVRLRTESGEKVMFDLRSANVTHPILSVSGMSKRGIPGSSGPQLRGTWKRARKGSN